MASETILVVDPDEAVGALLADILTSAGYRVAVARSIESARTLCDCSLDLIITEAFGQSYIFDFDPTFLREFGTFAPGTPIVLCSIHPSIDTIHPGDYGLVGVVRKPCLLRDLLGKVNTALSRHKGTMATVPKS